MSPRRPRRPGFWRILLRILLGLILFVALALLGARFFLFPRGRYHLPTTTLRLSTEDGVSLAAILLDHDSEDLVIVVHGIFASKDHPEVIRLAEEIAVEFDVLAVDLRGHGESGGAYAFDFSGAATDLRAAIEWGEAQGYHHIGTVGYSLGAAAAVLEQAEYDNLDSLVAVSCPATERMANILGPWAWSELGTWFWQLMGTRVAVAEETKTWPAQVAHQIAPVPLLVVHGEKDPFLPNEVSQEFYSAAREPKDFLSLPKEGHAQLGQDRGRIREWFRDTLVLEELSPLPWAHFIERQVAGQPAPGLPDERGFLSGRVFGEGGEPLPGALVLVSTETGHTFTAYSDADGQFRLEAPPGSFVPIATAPGYEAALFRHGSDPRTPVKVVAGSEVDGVEFSLLAHQFVLPDPQAVSLTLAPATEVSAPNPYPVTARRQQAVFTYGDQRIDSCFVYEPLTATGSLPVIFALYPSEAPRWQLVSVPMTAAGYVVLACGPYYVEDLGQLDLPGYARGLAVAWSLMKDGRLSSHADPSRYGMLTGSISTFILALALPKLDAPEVVVGIGGGYDLFLVLRDLYENPDYALDERLAMGLAALGRPDLYPETFTAVSLHYHATDLPPLALFHSAEDEMLLVNQAEVMAATLEDLGRPVELNRYEDLGHYPGVADPTPAAIQMYWEIMETFGRYLEVGE